MEGGSETMTTKDLLNQKLGYSLPSGHSMMSLLVTLFLVYKSRSLVVLIMAVVLELFIVFEIIYLGTHTSNDMSIGFAFGVTWFSIYVYFEDRFRHHKKHYFQSSPRLLTLGFIILCALVLAEVYLLEKYEARLDDATSHPVEWRTTYERNCRLGEGQGAKKMRNSTAYEKTALLFGLVLAESLRQLFKIHGFLDHKTNVMRRVVRTVLFFAIFCNAKPLLAAVVGPLKNELKYLPLLVQPMLMLVVFPLFAQLVNLGKFRGAAVRDHED